MPNSANSACSSISAPADQAACDPQSFGSCAGGTGTECTTVVNGPQATCVATKDDSNSPCAWTSTNACSYETITRMGGMLGGSLFSRTLCGGAFAIPATQTQLTSEGGGTGRLGCCPAGSFMSNPLLAPFVIANSCSLCPTGRFSSVENDDTSCTSCPDVVDATCTSCSDKDTCTAVTCAVNKFDTNAVATDGCEVGCPVVAGGTCTSCSDKDTCTAVTCAANKFDTNAAAIDGCEVGCPVVVGATCTSCSNKDTCTAITCDANKFDTNADIMDGCEVWAPCPPGSFINDVTSTCDSCPVATYSEKYDEKSCIECDRGKCSAAGSTSCTKCAALPDDCKGVTCDHTTCDRSCGIRKAVDDFLQDYRDINGTVVSKPSTAGTKTEVIAMYGNIEDWIVSQITTMAYLFFNKITANPDLSKWILSDVSPIVTYSKCKKIY